MSEALIVTFENHASRNHLSGFKTVRISALATCSKGSLCMTVFVTSLDCHMQILAQKAVHDLCGHARMGRTSVP